MKTRNGLFADVPEEKWNDWKWQVANRATFGQLFDRDMGEAGVRRRHRAMLGDVVVGWLRA